jgi:undecaprenyl pyrophosphate phosphatase UppP
MQTLYVVLFLVELFSTYLLDKLKIYFGFLVMALGTVLVLNDWNNAVVPDDTMKLSFLLSIPIMYLVIWYNIYTEDSKIITVKQ